jgi:hypothetical protein
MAQTALLCGVGRIVVAGMQVRIVSRRVIVSILMQNRIAELETTNQIAEKNCITDPILPQGQAPPTEALQSHFGRLRAHLLDLPPPIGDRGILDWRTSPYHQINLITDRGKTDRSTSMRCVPR